MFKTANIVGTAAAVLTTFSAGAFAPALAGPAPSQSNGITSCDAPGGRQEAGAVIGGVLGGVLGNRVAGRRNRVLGTVVGAGAGAAAGSYVGCEQQRDRAQREGYAYEDGRYRALRTVRVRSGPGMGYNQLGTVQAGDRFDVRRSSNGFSELSTGGWVNSDYIAMN